jgi:hypothetical protein
VKAEGVPFLRYPVLKPVQGYPVDIAATGLTGADGGHKKASLFVFEPDVKIGLVERLENRKRTDLACVQLSSYGKIRKMPVKPPL